MLRKVWKAVRAWLIASAVSVRVNSGSVPIFLSLAGSTCKKSEFVRDTRHIECLSVFCINPLTIDVCLLSEERGIVELFFSKPMQGASTFGTLWFDMYRVSEGATASLIESPGVRT